MVGCHQCAEVKSVPVKSRVCRQTERPRRGRGGGEGQKMQIVIDKGDSRKDISFLFFPQVHSSEAQKTNYGCEAFNVSYYPAGVAAIQLISPTHCRY